MAVERRSQYRGLSLAEIESFNPGARTGTRDWVSFRCPLPACGGKDDPALRANRVTGGYRCHRCGASGILDEFQQRAVTGRVGDRLAGARRTLHRELALPQHVTASQSPAPETWTWRAQWNEAIAILGPGAGQGVGYLAGRGLDPVTAGAAGLRFHPCFGTAEWRNGTQGRPAPAVLVPLRGADGSVSGVQGRFINGRKDDGWRRMQTGGAGVFLTAGCLIDDGYPQLPPGPIHGSGGSVNPAFHPVRGSVSVCEGPYDALALADDGPDWEGRPTIALLGTGFPSWLLRHVLGQTVFLGHDADEACDAAAARHADMLVRAGAKPSRLRPPDPAKDWADARSRWVASRVVDPGMQHPGTFPNAPRMPLAGHDGGLR